MVNSIVNYRRYYWEVAFVLILAGVTNGDTIYTPLGTSVYVFSNVPDFSQTEKDIAAAWVNEHYPQATILSEACKLYNCHSYAWNVSEGGSYYWMNDPWDNKYWVDGSYIQESDSTNGEKVSYPYGDHSAIETTTDDIFDSKWGAYPLCRHARTHCPYDDPDYRATYYSRYTRVIQSKTYLSGSDIKVASHDTLLVQGTTTVRSGAKVKFVSNGPMVINAGFTVESGGTFTARTW